MTEPAEKMHHPYIDYDYKKTIDQDLQENSQENHRPTNAG